MIRFATVLALCATPAMAEPQPAVAELMPYMTIVEDCFYSAEDAAMARACIGQGTGICMDADSNNQTTVGMMFCALAEAEAWDQILNAEYREIMAGMREEDAREAEFFPEFANRADSLLAAQRAWITLRDADCALEYALWGSGSMRQIAGADCQMQRTAERTIYLHFLGANMR